MCTTNLPHTNTRNPNTTHIHMEVTIIAMEFYCEGHVLCTLHLGTQSKKSFHGCNRDSQSLCEMGTRDTRSDTLLDILVAAVVGVELRVGSKSGCTVADPWLASDRREVLPSTETSLVPVALPVLGGPSQVCMVIS